MQPSSFCVMIAGTARLGMEEYIRKGLLHLMERSKKDPGCIAYNIHESIDHPGEFMVYMIFENEAAFEAHNQTPEMQEFKKKLAALWFDEQSSKTYWRVLN